MLEGMVIKFTEKPGWGFIKRDDGGKDVFFHHTGIIGEGFKTLDKGDKVEFEIVEGERGLQAANVRKI